MASEIDLENPGTLTATAENAKDYVIYIVKAKPQYTPKAFQANPNCVSGGDLFFKSDVLPDKGGKVEVDLGPKAIDLKRKMKDAGLIKVKAVALATAKPGNQDPAAKLAVMEPCDLKKIPPTIEMSTEEDKKIFKVGQKFAVKFLVKGIEQVSIKCEPAGAFKFPKDTLTKTEILEIEAAKAVKGTIIVSGTSIGGSKIEKKLDLEAEGPSLKIAGMGFIEKG
jgi:hypothetical protein